MFLVKLMFKDINKGTRNVYTLQQKNVDIFIILMTIIMLRYILKKELKPFNL